MSQAEPNYTHINENWRQRLNKEKHAAQVRSVVLPQPNILKRLCWLPLAHLFQQRNDLAGLLWPV